ncbi:MAG: DUF4157 domain-containing protein [Panacibacter sp.]
MNTFDTKYHPNKTITSNCGSKVFIQPKLTINNPNDQYETEADAVADKVMRMESPSIQTKAGNNLFFKPAPIKVNTLQRKCVHCGEDEKKMQRKEMNGEEATADEGLENYVGTLSSDGQPLPNEARNFYEPRFGYDFSNVKVHTDSIAAKSAQSINALAYTSGSNIVFNNGQYSPNTDSGKRLLGHELTHVIQQGAVQNNKSDIVMREEKPENELKSCPVPQKAQLLPIIEDARKAVSFATAVVATAWGRPDKIEPNRKKLLLDHFHTIDRGDLRDIMGKYISLEHVFDTGLEVKCETTCPKDAAGVVCGYAYNTQWFGGFGPIHICFDKTGCDFTTTPKTNKIALIIHETAHRHTGVDDKAYKWDPKYYTQSADDAMDNADTYGWFAALL